MRILLPQSYKTEIRGNKDEKKKKKAAPKPKKRQDYDDYDDYDDVYDDEPMSKAPIIILAIAIVVVAGVIAYMLLK